jgi:sugar lactone lactonase YvrE
MKFQLSLIGLSALAMAGCGGGVTDPPAPGGGGNTSKTVGTAKLRVDLGSGVVTVTPLNNNPEDRAIFTGNAVGVSSSRVLDDAGEVTVRGIDITLTNNTERAIGAKGSFRVVLSDFANLSGLSTDYSTDTIVLTPAAETRPYGIAVDSEGSVYFSSKPTGNLYKMVGGSTARLAGGFNAPTGVVDLPGTDFLAVADNVKHVVSLVSKNSGGKTTIAGSGTAGSADGIGTSASFSSPDGLAVDSIGNIYVSDAGTGRIRMISDPFGTPVVSTLISSGMATISDIDVLSIQGTEYLVIAVRHAVYGVALPGGSVFTIAGHQTVSGNANGAGDIARFDLVRGVAARNGAIFVMDALNYQVKQITLDPGGNVLNSADWHVALLAGDSTNAHTDGVGNVAQFQYSQHLAASPSGRLYAASYSGDSIRMVKATDSVLPFLGQGSGSGGGNPIPVRMANPDGYYYDTVDARPFKSYDTSLGGLSSGESMTLETWTFYIPDNVAAFEFVMAVESETALPAVLPANLSPGGTPAGSSDVFVRAIAGAGSNGAGDGPSHLARFNNPRDVEVDETGTIYVADFVNKAIRMITPDGQVSTILGDVTRSDYPSSTTGDLVSFKGPSGLAVNRDGSVIYIADTISNMVCRATLRYSYLDNSDPASWDVTVIAGTGVSGYVNGDGTTALFNSPLDVAIAGVDETLYVSDSGLDKIRLMRTDGRNPSLASSWQVSLYAGSTAVSSTNGFVDGWQSAARFDSPAGLDVGPDGTLYVADFLNSAVRMISPSGWVTTLSGSPADGFADSTSGTTAKFLRIQDVAVDAAGYVFASDYFNDAVRRIAPVTGETRTVVGNDAASTIDGAGNETKVLNPHGVALLPGGSLVVTSVLDNTIHRAERIINDASR